MALILGELAAILKTDNTRLRRGLDEGERDVRQSGRRMERDATTTGQAMGTAIGAGGASGGEWFSRDAAGRVRDSRGRFVQAGEEAGDALGEGIHRGADGKLRDARGRFVKEGAELGRAAAGGARGGLDLLRSALSNVGTAATNILTNVWNLIPAILGLVAAAGVAVPAVSLLGGVLGSLPALAVGGGAAIGTLMLGFHGLSDAFKSTAGSGGAAVDKTWQIHQAQRALANAQREVVAAQRAVTRAREDEVERLSDLNRELREARLNELEAAESEKEAQQQLADAQNMVSVAQDKLNRAYASGDAAAIREATEELLEAQREQPAAIRRAELAYERAKLAMEKAADATDDLTKEQERAKRLGVDGSDQVSAALERQRRAVEAVEDAEHALAEARKPAGGGGGAASEMVKLAPAAREVVAAIKSLKPAWESLRLDVQQKLFAGVGGEIKSLASAWLPTLHERLGGMAETFNGLFKNFSKSAKKPEFIAGISAGIESVQRLIDRVGRSLTGPFMDAFGRLSKAAGPFLDALGDEVGDLVDDFSAWIKTADKSGGLERFMKMAAGFLRDAVDMGRDVGSIFGSIMQILFEEKSISTSPWVGLRESLDSVAKWFKDPENQERVREWIDRIKDFGVWLATEGIPTVAKWVSRVSGWVTKAQEWGGKIVAFKNDVQGAFNSIVSFFSGLPKRISRATSGMWNGLWASFKSTVNRIISHWNNLSFTIGGGTAFGQQIPSVTLGTPNIPYLAQGGIVRATPGGRLAVVGEGGQDEAVIPLSKLGNLGGHSELRITGELVARGSDLVVVLRERVSMGGGNVQRVIGSTT
ncbi:hypothetical protein AB0M91_19520 [Micromonospora rifamycinica]|uniref:hypothetical protein n=1 Tax=Micromonospora rifamycinica TaxID=291594 RepID=UPI0034134258